MANNTIQIKRNNSDAAVPTLAFGELAWIDAGDGTAGSLYIGNGEGTAVAKKIGGGKWGLELLTDTILTGDATVETGGSLKYASDPGFAPNSGSAPGGANNFAMATLAYVDAQVVAGGTIDALGDTAISGAVNGTVASGQVLIYGTDPDDTQNNRWVNKPLTGDVGINNDGLTAVSSVTGKAIQLNANTSGTYVSSVTQAADGNIIVLPNVTGDADAVTIGLANSVTIAGDLTVNGTTTTVATDVVTLKDPVFQIGEQLADSADRGIKIDWNDGTNPKEGFFGHDVSANAFTYVPDGITGNVANGAAGDAIFGGITGTTIDVTTITGSVELTAPSVVGTTVTGELQTPSQTNITGLGTITTGIWNATEISAAHGGTGLTGLAANEILIGSGTGVMSTLAMSTTGGDVLQVNAAGTALVYGVLDGGTF